MWKQDNIMRKEKSVYECTIICMQKNTYVYDCMYICVYRLVTWACMYVLVCVLVCVCMGKCVCVCMGKCAYIIWYILSYKDISQSRVIITFITIMYVTSYKSVITR